MALGVQKPQHFEVRADLPGTAKDDIILQADGNIITLSVEKKKTEEQVRSMPCPIQPVPVQSLIHHRRNFGGLSF